jgi:hypothetical protein
MAARKAGRRPSPARRGNSGFTLYVKDDVPLLRASELPAPLDEPRFPPAWKILEGESDFSALARGEALEIGPHQKQCVVFDWRDYVAAYPTVEVSGGAGATPKIGWCEAPAHPNGDK